LRHRRPGQDDGFLLRNRRPDVARRELADDEPRVGRAAAPTFDHVSIVSG
jgi:hypothetical protein